VARFLFTCWPFDGHVVGPMAVATAARDRGHEVAFYTGESARAAVEQEAFAIFPFRRVREERAYQNVRALEQRTRTSGVQLVRTFRDWLVETIPGQVADLQAVLSDWRPDVVVTDVSMWAPIVIFWETAQIPVAIYPPLMGPLIPGPDAPPWGLGLAPPRTRREQALARALTRTTELFGTPLRRRVDAFRREHGLPPMGCTVNAFTGRLPLYLVGSLRELDYNRHDLPASVHYLGACIWHPPDDSETAGRLDELPANRPWVHVTESTLHYGDPFILRAATNGLGRSSVEVILTTGRQRDPDQLGLGPFTPNVHLLRWVSHSTLLPRCAAVVTAGGTATIVGALQLGVPLVVVPTRWDKPDNARRVVEAGVGVRLRPRECTPDKLRAAVEQVLDEPKYRANAQRIAGAFARAPGALRAAELLETLAHREAEPSRSVGTAGARGW
jgi:MGT family glycosyltransferase